MRLSVTSAFGGFSAGLAILCCLALGVRGQPPPPPNLAVSPAATNTLGATNALGPRIKFESTINDFGKVKSGDSVQSSYTYTNVGDQVLVISSVQPGCGCTTAGEWTKQVEPGKTGSFSVQFNSTHFNGAVMKTITVSCNDPTQRSVMLQLKGTVWKPVDVSPPYAVLNIPPDAVTASTTVKIVNNMEQPIRLDEPTSSNPAFSAVIQSNSAGKEFSVVVSAKTPFTSGNQGLITFKTSSTNAPTVTVNVWANVQPALTISPLQIVLPPPPVANAITNLVTILNNTTNAIQCSDLALDVPGVEVRLLEGQPGKQFTAQVMFPAGFELPRGRQCALTLKSTHPQYSVIRVPLMQLPRTQGIAAPTPPPPATH
jgi:hypothetical protein